MNEQSPIVGPRPTPSRRVLWMVLVGGLLLLAVSFSALKFYRIDVSQFFAAEPAGFVSVQGDQLMLNGQRWWSKGANWIGARYSTRLCLLAGNAADPCNGSYLDADHWNPAEMELEFRWLHEVLGLNTLRLPATDISLENGNGQRILEFVRSAYRQGIRIHWVYGFGVPYFTCTKADGSTEPCYVYGKPDIGNAVLMPPGTEEERAALAKAENFSTLFRNEPGVLSYEVGNEILLNGTVRSVGYQEQVLSYIKRLTDALRRGDPNHFITDGEVIVVEGPDDHRWPWVEQGVEFVKFNDIHNLNGGQPFSLFDVIDVLAPHMYQPPEKVQSSLDVLLAGNANRKPVLFGEYGGGGITGGHTAFPDPIEQGRTHKAILDQARERLSGAWVWNPVPTYDFQPGTYRIDTWQSNSGLRPMLFLFGPPERSIRLLSLAHYIFRPQNNTLNPLVPNPAALELANRKAQFVAQSVPTTMVSDRQYPISITLKNTGDSPWDRTAAPGTDQSYTWRIKPQNPPDNTNWGVASVPMSSAPILPNQTATFNFTVTAPSTPGTFDFQWQLNQGLVGWFGDLTPNVAVQVVAETSPVPTGGVTPSQYGLHEGDLVSAASSLDPDIYIINQNGYKRLFLNPVIFSFYGHLGGFQNVKTVSPHTRDVFRTSLYFKNCETNDPKVYAVQVTGEDTGVLHWLNLSQDQATQQDPAFNQKIFCINNNEYAWYPKGSEYTSLTQVPPYQR